MKITDKLDEWLTYIQARNPDCQVAYSSIFKCKDNPEFNKCDQEVNYKIKERLMQRGIDFIDNSNILLIIYIEMGFTYRQRVEYQNIVKI